MSDLFSRLRAIKPGEFQPTFAKGEDTTPIPEEQWVPLRNFLSDARKAGDTHLLTKIAYGYTPPELGSLTKRQREMLELQARHHAAELTGTPVGQTAWVTKEFIAPTATDGELAIWGRPPQADTLPDAMRYQGRHAEAEQPPGRHAAAEVGGTALSLFAVTDPSSPIALEDLRTGGRHAIDSPRTSVTIPLYLHDRHYGPGKIHNTPPSSPN